MSGNEESSLTFDDFLQEVYGRRLQDDHHRDADTKPGSTAEHPNQFGFHGDGEQTEKTRPYPAGEIPLPDNIQDRDAFLEGILQSVASQVLGSRGAGNPGSSGDSPSVGAGGSGRLSRDRQFLATVLGTLMGSRVVEEDQTGSFPGGDLALEGLEGPGEAFHHDLMREMSERCQVDLQEAFGRPEPVPMSDAQETMSEFGRYFEDIAGRLEGTDGSTDELQQAIKSSDSVRGALTEHRDAFKEVQESVEKAGNDALCAFSRIMPLRMRMEFHGLSGFQSSRRCTRAAAAVASHLSEHEMDLAAAMTTAMTRQTMDALADGIRADITCLARNAAHYRQYVDVIQNVGSDTTEQQMLLLVTGLESYGQGMTWDAMHVSDAIDIIARMTKMADTGNHPSKQTREDIKNRLKKLFYSFAMPSDMTV